MLLTLLLGESGAMPAVANKVYLGYSDGAIASSASGTVTGLSGNGATIECAIMLTSDMLAAYNDAALTAVRIGLPAASQMPDELTVWVRSSLDGENMAEATISAPAEGWNEAVLPQTVTDVKDGVYVGFSYTQEKKLNIISLVGNTNENGCWMAKNGTWANYADRDFGSLSIEAVLQTDDAVDCDLSLTDCKLTNSVIDHGKSTVCYGTVRNLAAISVEGFRVAYSLGDASGFADFSGTLDFGQTADFSLTIDGSSLPVGENQSLSVTVSMPDGTEDGNPANNTAVLPLTVYAASFPRTVLLEEFTTETCINCPAGAVRIKKGITSGGYDDDIIWTCHHAGFNTDWLTIDEHSDYLWFFNGNSFAPAIMLDRTNMSDYGADSEGPAYYPDTSASIAKQIGARLDNPALAQLSATCSVDDDHTLSINVSGERLSPLDKSNDVRLTVFVCESDIVARSQSGNDEGDYIHEPVVRAVVTDTWGDTVEWTDNNFAASYTAKIDDVIQATGNFAHHTDYSHVFVVAFLSHYDSSDTNSCQVINACKSMTADADGIETINNEQITMNNSAAYNLQGVRVSDSYKGIVIRGGKKFIVK